METTNIANSSSIDEILRAHAQWMHTESGEGRCILDGATLNGMNLTGADLQAAIIRGTTLLDAELSDAKLGKAIIDAADFQRALLGRADLAEARISESDFGFSWMAEAALSDAEIRNSDFRKANLRGARFQGALLESCKFPEATLSAASFNHARAALCDFSRERFRRSAVRTRADRRQPVPLGQRAGFEFQQLPPKSLRFRQSRPGARAISAGRSHRFAVRSDAIARSRSAQCAVGRCGPLPRRSDASAVRRSLAFCRGPARRGSDRRT